MHSRLDRYALQQLGREQSFEWTPVGEGLNPERLALRRSAEQSLKKKQKAGKRGKKRNERCRTGGETRAGEERWLGRRRGPALLGNNQESNPRLSIVTFSVTYYF